MAIIMDGKEVANKLYDKLKYDVSKLSTKPCLAVIMVGEDEASKIYVNNKTKACEKLEIESKLIKLPNSVSEKEITEEIEKLNKDESVTGILVQAPLPDHLDINKIFNLIAKEKDVDGFNNYNVGALVKNNNGFIPCTVKGIGYLLDYYNIDLSSKDVCVIGRSNIVGRPLASYLTNRNATVTLCHSKTKDLKEKTKCADVLIVAAGCPNLISENDVKEGAVVIDVGINRSDKGLCGDVDFEKVKNKCSYITPVPGGVGPMTVAMLMSNIIDASKGGFLKWID